MTDRIKNAIEVFLRTIETESLKKGVRGSCALSCLVEHTKGRYAESPYSSWSWLFCTDVNGTQMNSSPESIGEYSWKRGMDNIKATDFTFEECKIIENSFERNTKIHGENYHRSFKGDIRKDLISGIVAVLKEMKRFDKCQFSIKKEFTDKVKQIPL